jgi:hypothetical protein
MVRKHRVTGALHPANLVAEEKTKYRINFFFRCDKELSTFANSKQLITMVTFDCLDRAGFF